MRQKRRDGADGSALHWPGISGKPAGRGILTISNELSGF